MAGVNTVTKNRLFYSMYGEGHNFRREERRFTIMARDVFFFSFQKNTIGIIFVQ